MFPHIKVTRARVFVCVRMVFTEFVAVAGGGAAGVVCTERWRLAIRTAAKPRVLAVLLHGDRICYGTVDALDIDLARSQHFQYCKKAGLCETRIRSNKKSNYCSTKRLD